mmetsp:Transcript_14686/g.31634  ORF Transcript_14686/g.31634 Transcript_14686/m.31634 type:complete len:102 (+) Transcript_14686:1817-2122(+)
MRVHADNRAVFRERSLSNEHNYYDDKYEIKLLLHSSLTRLHEIYHIQRKALKRAVTENMFAAVVYCETKSAKQCSERGELHAFLKIQRHHIRLTLHVRESQ